MKLSNFKVNHSFLKTNVSKYYRGNVWKFKRYAKDLLRYQDDK